MSNKTENKYLNLVLSKITDITSFNVWTLLKDEEYFDFDLATEEQKHEMLDLSSRVQRLGVIYKYFDQIDHYEFRLTEKGIKAKELGGHENYEKFISKKTLDWYRIIPMFLTIIFGIISFYYANRNYNLKLKQTESTEKVTELEKQIQTSKSEVDSLKTELNKLINNTK